MIRKLELSDVFKLSEIIDVMGIDLDLNKLMDSAKSKEGNVQSNVGAEVAFLFIKKIHKAEKLVYKFIASLTGEKIEDVKKYGIKQMKAFFTELVNDEEFNDFFTQE
ncbi:MAG: hypothetical protein L0J35_00075 [Tetragenococcus halophilus]|nr:hypothetical protein [Tetragenococcus halophilus]